MQILTIDNPNFEKPSRNQSNKTKVKIKIDFFKYLTNKTLLRVCSHCSGTAKMFEHRNSSKSKEKNRNFFQILTKVCDLG
jgi:hypothetical protein